MAVVAQARPGGRTVGVADLVVHPAIGADDGGKAGCEVGRVGHVLCSVALGYKLLSLIGAGCQA